MTQVPGSCWLTRSPLLEADGDPFVNFERIHSLLELQLKVVLCSPDSSWLWLPHLRSPGFLSQWAPSLDILSGGGRLRPLFSLRHWTCLPPREAVLSSTLKALDVSKAGGRHLIKSDLSQDGILRTLR